MESVWEANGIKCKKEKLPTRCTYVTVSTWRRVAYFRDAARLLSYLFGIKLTLHRTNSRYKRNSYLKCESRVQSERANTTDEYTFHDPGYLYATVPAHRAVECPVATGA